MNKKAWWIAGAALAGGALGMSLDRLQAGHPATSIARAKSVQGPAYIELPKALRERAKLTLEPAREESLASTLRLVGSVNFDADEVAEIGARIEGRVARILVSVGDEVKRGDALVEIESEELGEAAAALLGAHANLIAAEHHERRESELEKQQLSSAPIVERARAEVKALRAKVHGAEQRLLTMGFGMEELQKLMAGQGLRRVTLRAPLDGEVVTRSAVLGQVVGPTEPVLRVANLDRLWVELEVFERDLAHVAEGDTVRIESETHPGKSFEGRVAHVEATVDLATRSAHVRIEGDNHERLLRPGQFVTARLATASEPRTVLAVPRAAVLQVEGQPSVFVAVSENKFLVRPVEQGASAGDRVEIKRGLAPGDMVVTGGAFALKSELLR